MRKIIVFPIIFLLLAGLMSAQMEMPFFIGGQVQINGERAGEGLQVKITNVEKGTSVIKTTDGQGYYLLDLDSELYSDYELISKRAILTGDTLKFEVLGQVKEYYLDKGGAHSFNVVITTTTPVPKHTCWEGTVVADPDSCPPKIQCSDGTFVTDVSSCPVKKPEVIEYFVCADGSKVFSADDCPVISDKFGDSLFELALIILGVFGFGAGFVALARYYWRRGKPGDKERAVKMLSSAIKKAKEGKYSKHRK